MTSHATESRIPQATPENRRDGQTRGVRSVNFLNFRRETTVRIAPAGAPGSNPAPATAAADLAGPAILRHRVPHPL